MASRDASLPARSAIHGQPKNPPSQPGSRPETERPLIRLGPAPKVAKKTVLARFRKVLGLFQPISRKKPYKSGYRGVLHLTVESGPRPRTVCSSAPYREACSEQF